MFLSVFLSVQFSSGDKLISLKVIYSIFISAAEKKMKSIKISYFSSVKIRLFLRFGFLSGFLGVKVRLFLRFGFLSGLLGVKIHLFSRFRLLSGF